MNRSEMSCNAKNEILRDLLKHQDITVLDGKKELDSLKNSLPRNVKVVDNTLKNDGL